MKKLLKTITASLFIGTVMLSGCSNNNQSAGDKEQDQLAQIQEKGVMVVGTEGTYSPNSYHDDEGNLVGFDVEVADRKSVV